MSNTGATFIDYLRSRINGPLPATDDVLGAVMPLLKQVHQVHERGLVAPLAGLQKLRVSDDRFWFAEAEAHAPKHNASAVKRLEHEESRALEIVGRQDIRDNEQGVTTVTNKLIGKRGEEITQPLYLPGYISWEHELDHHDQLTDVYSLGLLLASLSFNLDLSDDEDLARFVDQRHNLFSLNAHIHPVLAKAIARMTEPRRKNRAQDLPSIVTALTHYRVQVSGPDLNFSAIRGFREANRKGRTQIIQERLRDRLFEISRRNRLLYFRPTMQMLNLTVGSVPVLLDYKNISPDALCTWQGDFEKTISAGSTVQLGKYLRFEDQPYLSGVLDQIRNQEARDRNEYGFSQLRLVVAFLRWHNLKENKEERITSPLVLLPVALDRKKGIRDSYTLTPTSSEAELNPVLRHHLKQIYGLQLPEFIDLSQTTLKAFFELLQQQIQKSEPGITLRLIERPQIKLIHERARARLEQFRRRSRLTGRGVRSLENIDYSYSRENFNPLGLQLFLKRVKPSPSPYDSLINETPHPRMPNMVAIPEALNPDPSVREKDMFVLQEESEANPYVWDFDLCSLTLGNFNYRKMSLVRDYTTLLESDIPNAAFDAAFSLLPRKAEFQPMEPLPPEDSFQIVASDPTQMAAVTRARSGASYIIQGPPGTGKSQTITNLIADYISRGKRVLFVCEKRAAIDVVFYRLKQRGLERLCCLIHDSQSDKKAFIQDLKATYEHYLNTPDRLKDVEAERETVCKHIRMELDVLQHFSDAMKRMDAHDELPLRHIYERLIDLAEHLPKVDDALAERLPRYACWRRHGDDVRSLARVLGELKLAPVFAKSSLRLLARKNFSAERPIEAITSGIERTEAALQKLQRAATESGLPAEFFASVDTINALAAYAEKLHLLASHDLLHLLDRAHPDNARLKDAAREQAELQANAQAAAAKTANWRQKIPEADLQDVLDSAQSLENSILRFFMPAFWRLRGILNARYNFAAHVVAPKWSRVLKDLQEHYAAERALAGAAQRNRERFKVAVDELLALLSDLHGNENSLSPAEQEFRQRLLNKALGAETVSRVLSLRPLLKALTDELAQLFENARARSLAQLATDLPELRGALPLLPELLPILRELTKAPPEFYLLLCEQPWTAEQIEAGILLAAVASAYRQDRALPRLDCRVLAQHVERLGTAYQQAMSVNAKTITQRLHSRFLEHVNLSGQPAAQLTAEQKEWKKAYAKGRRELEHEFGKVMRYRSIRDLAGDETGLVVGDLKPVWLMSPLSVSDTLPLANTNFDVVIFDEASQIPVEEAIPALYRAPQVIVVGDEKQLPPTDFFSAKSDEEDAEGVVIEEDGERISFELTADSFLTQTATNLPSTMLGWHYRSRSESLISFSNAAFYGRKLLTIPDVSLPLAATTIVVSGPEAGGSNVANVLDRAVSFHYLGNGIYEDRRNASEAAYIARLVRGLLQKKTGMSIGIVAFSEAQQGEIECALEALAGEDAAFAELLEAEYQREENDQFCGMFVKNLENVQGDERDIIILSVCYGYDRAGKMLMNFGPINKNGGEKRLNVVFSRARRHMVLVSSIKSAAITNDYNDGASCLKRYLAYAEALSSGQHEMARRVLQSFADAREQQSHTEADAVARSLAKALKARGYLAELAVGDSHFRCDVAVRKPGDTRHRLAVLIDKLPASRNEVLERWLLQPAVLQGFDWKAVQLTAKDWHHDPSSVLATIERALQPSE
ncbi:MAG TPA: AAA domain-containing protein [Planctomycetota bacterium]|nr:AAA domain-containing protein [Planctomycetota bacterium]